MIVLGFIASFVLGLIGVMTVNNFRLSIGVIFLISSHSVFQAVFPHFMDWITP